MLTIAAEQTWKRTLYIIFFAQLVTSLGFYIIVPFLPFYVEELGSSTNLSLELLSGLVFSAPALTMMVASPLWGTLADKHGRKPMAERAAFGAAITVFLMAFAQSAEQLVLLRAAQGILSGVLSANSALVASIAPRKQVGYAMGILQVGLWAGVSIGPMVGGVVADTLGFRATFVITCLLLITAGLMIRFGVHEMFTPTAHHKNSMAHWRDILRLPGVGQTYAVRFLVWLGRTILLPFTPLYVALLLHDDAPIASMAGIVVGMAALAGTVSAIYLGKLGDRVGHRRVLIGGLLVGVVFYLPQSWVTEVWQLLVLQLVTGAAIGGIVPALSALLASYTEPGQAGAVYGLENSIGAAARVVAPMIGAGIVMTIGLRGVYSATAVVFLLAAGVALWRLPRNLPAYREALAVMDEEVAFGED